MNIEGLGESLVDQLLERELVKDFADLYRSRPQRSKRWWSTPREPRSERARAAQARARSAATSSSRSTAAEANDLVAADLRPRHPPRRREGGRRPWRGRSGRWTALLEAPVEALQTVPEIGPVVAASVRAFADEPHNRALIAKLAAAGVNMAVAAAAPSTAPAPVRWRGGRSC